jgi:hypothetical protein
LFLKFDHCSVGQEPLEFIAKPGASLPSIRHNVRAPQAEQAQRPLPSRGILRAKPAHARGPVPVRPRRRALRARRPRGPPPRLPRARAARDCAGRQAAPPLEARGGVRARGRLVCPSERDRPRLKPLLAPLHPRRRRSRRARGAPRPRRRGSPRRIVFSGPLGRGDSDLAVHAAHAHL